MQRLREPRLREEEPTDRSWLRGVHWQICGSCSSRAGGVCVWGVTLGERTCLSAPDSGHEPMATCLSSCQPIFSWEAQVVSVTGL